MKLHYMGKYDKNPESIAHGEHQPNAVQFKEADGTKQLAIIANIICIIIMIFLAVLAFLRLRNALTFSQGLVWQLILGSLCSLVILFPHELLHAVCFKQDVYLYTDLSEGLLFVTGPETMSKAHFVIMCLCPNIILGFIPFAIGMIFPKCLFFTVLGILAIGMGAGDYYNVFNAVTQMPKGARTYMYSYHSYWYMPQ